MPQATISGSTGPISAIAIKITSDQAQAAAQRALNNISNLISSQGFTVRDITNGNFPNISTVGLISGTKDVNLGLLLSNVQALIILNTGTTNVGNLKEISNEFVVAASGGLIFNDNGASTSIVTSGGTNIVNFGTSSNNSVFVGDGSNTLNISTASGITSVFGTSYSADTIIGSAYAKSDVAYTSEENSSVFINPSAGNVTVFGNGGLGSETVFGGSLINTFTGRLIVVDGTGYFQAGTTGNNVLGSSTVGSTTLIGGGGNDVLSAKGVNDVLVAGSGSETLDGSYSAGGDTFWASSTGTSLMYGSALIGDTFFTNNSTVLGVGFTGSFINFHTTPNAQLRGLNSSIPNILAIGFSEKSANYATIGDFISGVDKLVINTAVTGSNYTLTSGNLIGPSGSVLYTNLQTANGSIITIYNAILTNNDVIKI